MVTSRNEWKILLGRKTTTIKPVKAAKFRPLQGAYLLLAKSTLVYSAIRAMTRGLGLQGRPGLLPLTANNG